MPRLRRALLPALLVLAGVLGAVYVVGWARGDAERLVLVVIGPVIAAAYGELRLWDDARRERNARWLARLDADDRWVMLASSWYLARGYAIEVGLPEPQFPDQTEHVELADAGDLEVILRWLRACDALDFKPLPTFDELKELGEAQVGMHAALDTQRHLIVSGKRPHALTDPELDQLRSHSAQGWDRLKDYVRTQRPDRL